MTDLTPADVEAEGRRMMQQYVGQKVPVHGGAPDGPVIGEAEIIGIDWERNAFLAEITGVPTPIDHANLFTNVQCEGHA